MAYKGFISYSHAADNQYAPALQSALHKFAKPFNRLRAMHIFRDRTDLSANPALWPVIKKALDESEYLLLLASPDSARSKWVKKELDYWLTIHNGQVDKLLIIMTDGDLAWNSAAGDFDWEKTTAIPQILDWEKADSAPNSLAGKFTEPLYVDHRLVKTEKDLSLRNPRFLDGVATLAATLHGKPKSEMIGDDVKAHTRYRKARTSATCGLAILFILAAGFGIYANQQRLNAEAALQLAEERRIEAENEKRIAEEQRNIAFEQRSIADTKTEQARKAAEEEKKAKDIAQERTKEAEKQTEIANQRRKEAEIATEKEKVATTKALDELSRNQRLLYATDMKYADSLYLEGDIETYSSILNKYENINSILDNRRAFDGNLTPIGSTVAINQKIPVYRGFEWNYLKHLSGSLTRFEKFDNFYPQTLEFSTSGKYLLSGGVIHRLEEDMRAAWVVWDTKTGEKLKSVVSEEDMVAIVKFSPNERWLASVSDRSGLQIWRIDRSNNISFNSVPVKLNAQPASLNLESEETFEVFTFTSDSSLLTVSSFENESKRDYVIRRWNLDLNCEISKPEKIDFDKNFQIGAISPKGHFLLISYENRDSAYQISLLRIENEEDRKRGEFPIEKTDFDPAELSSMVVSVDEKFLAISNVTGRDGSVYNHRVTIWNAIENQPIKEFKDLNFTDDLPPKFVFSPGNLFFAITTEDSFLIWDIEKEKARAIPSFLNQYNPLTFSPDGKKIAIGNNFRGSVIIRSINNESSSNRPFDLHGERFVEMSPAKNKILTVNKDKVLSLWNLDKEHTPTPLRKFKSNWQRAKFSPNGKYFYVTESDIIGEASHYLWNSESLKEITTENSKECIARGEDHGLFSPDDKIFAQACQLDNGYRVVIWNLEVGRALFEFRVAPGYFLSDFRIEFSENGKHLIAYERRNGNFLEIWDIDTQKKLSFAKPENEKIIGFYSTGDWFVTQQENRFFVRKILPGLAKRYLIWEKSGKSSETPKIHSISSSKFEIDINEKIILSLDLSIDTVNISKRENDLYHTPRESFGQLFFEVRSRPGEVAIWNRKTGREITIGTDTARQTTTAYAFSPDEKRLITGYNDGTIKFWDLDIGTEVLSIKSGKQQVSQLALTADNKRLIAVAADNSIQLWDTESGNSREER